MLLAFELGREYRLSIAEIFCVFPQARLIAWNQKILVVDSLDLQDAIHLAPLLGGTIKIMECVVSFGPDLTPDLERLFTHNHHEGKFHFGVNTFGKFPHTLKSLLKISKIIIKEAGFNPRFINKDDSNLSSASIIHEKLIEKRSDFNLIECDGKLFGAVSVWVQDIDAYSKRDYDKLRDMHTGMLPPKLAQMMINFSKSSSHFSLEKGLYDPFVGLGTVLIEAQRMGYQQLWGSDLNEKMVEQSTKNLERCDEHIEIFLQNSKYIHEVKILSQITTIVTEGYLGEIMTQKNISTPRIEKQKKSLLDLYEGFFAGLKKGGFQGNIIISFPFWELEKKYVYFEDIYALLDQFCIKKRLGGDFNTSPEGSLLYKRPAQLVGREIFHLEMK